MSDLVYEHRMSASDALMWNIEKDPILRSTITAVGLLDRSPDRDRLMAKMERATREIPRMRQRVVSSPISVAPPRWATDPTFDLGYHVRFVRAPGDGSLRDLLDVVEPIAMAGFDRARPLWEMVIVDGLEGGRAAVVQKLHHAITDGVGGIQIAMSMVDLERDPPEDGPLPATPPADQWSYPRRMVDAARYETTRQIHRLRRTVAKMPGLAVRPVSTARQSTTTAASLYRLLRPVTEPLSPIMRDRSLSVRFDTISLPLADLKAAGRAIGGSLNDAFVAGVAGGLAAYHAEMDSPVTELRMNMPISIRAGDDAALAGNQFVPARFSVPVGEADPAARMRQMRELVTTQRAEPALAFTGAIADALNRLPTSLVTEVFGKMLKGIDFTTSNVPGVPIPIYVGGAQLDALIPFGPLAGAAVNVTLVSHLDDVHMGINMDPAAVTEPDLLVRCLADCFDAVVGVGSKDS